MKFFFSCTVPVRQISGCIDFILCASPCCIKTGCCQFFLGFCFVSIGKPGRVFPISDLSYPSTQITLINVVIIVCRLNSRVYNIMDPDIRIIIGHVKIALVTKVLAPAVGTDKSAVPFQLHIEVFFWIIIIPAYDHRIMVGLFRTDITIGIGITIVINRLAFIIPHGRIKGTLHTAFQINCFFDRFVIF